MSYEWLQPGRERGGYTLSGTGQLAKTTREPLVGGGSGVATKPVYPGSYAQWLALPEYDRMLYQAPREPGLEASWQPTTILDVARRHPERYEIREAYPFGPGTEAPRTLPKPPEGYMWEPTSAKKYQEFPKGAYTEIIPKAEAFTVAPSKKREPPKDAYEWFSRATEGIVEVFTKRTGPAYFVPGRGMVMAVSERQRMFMPYYPASKASLRMLEETQAWLRADPTVAKVYSEAAANALEVAYAGVGAFRVAEFGTTLLGAGISTVISPLPYQLGGRAKTTAEPLSKYWEATKKHPWIVPGEIVTEIALAKYVWGPAASEAWKGLQKIPVVARTTIKISQAYQTSRLAKYIYKVELSLKKALPSFRGSKLDVFLAKHWNLYYRKTGGIVAGEVALPQLYEPLSFKSLEASQTAWGLTVAPHTSGVWLRNLGLAPAKTKVLPHLIARGGLISIGYLREPLLEEPYWQRGLLPYVTQKQVTRMGIVPYAPKIATSLGKKVSLGPLLSLGAVTLPKLVQPQAPKRKQAAKLLPALPKVWQPTLAYQREAFRNLEREATQVKEKQRLAPFAIPKLTQAQKSEAQQITKTIQRQTQKLVSIPKIPKLTQLTIPTPFYPRIPHGGTDFSKLGRGLFGKWFKREHKIITPQQLAKQFGFSIPGKKRKAKPKKKTTRKKRRK